MRSFFVCLAALLLVTANCEAASQNPTILIVGDSLSSGYGVDADQGWVALLRDRLNAEGYGYRVVNASISGDTTSGGVRRMPRALEKHEPGIVIIELGGNDGLRGTPIEIIRGNLSSMIRMADERGADVVLAGMQMPPNYGDEYTQDFRQIYPDLASRYGVALIGFFMENVALDPSKMMADQIHPNEAGQPLLLDNVWPVLKELLVR